jgi:hypothetical protein
MSGTRPLACPLRPPCDSPRFAKSCAHRGAVRSTDPPSALTGLSCAPILLCDLSRMANSCTLSSYSCLELVHSLKAKHCLQSCFSKTDFTSLSHPKLPWDTTRVGTTSAWPSPTTQIAKQNRSAREARRAEGGSVLRTAPR